MKFCINCRSQLPDGATFCGNCGAKQGDTARPSNPSTSNHKEVQLQYQPSGQYQNQNRSTGLEKAPFKPSVPSIRFIWPRPTLTHMLCSYVPWFNNLNVEINGMKQTPENGIKFKNGLVVDVPITSERNRIECWLTTPVVKQKINFQSRTIDLNIDPSFSYIVEIKNPLLFYLLGAGSLIKYKLKDIKGNILFEG